MKSYKLFKTFRKEYQFLILLLPAVAYFVIFHYLPIYGIIIAFKDLKIGSTILEAQWVGFKWFEQFFDSPQFWRSLKNTLLLSSFSILFFFPLPILFALLLNEIRNQSFKKTTQIVSSLPYFISTPITVGILINLLSYETGAINQFIQSLGFEKINFFIMPEWFRPLYISTDIWQEMGWTAIIYFAALTSINPSLYEAARVDGASRIMQMWHITLPGILSTIMILLILRIGTFLAVGFEKVILMYNPAIYVTADIVSSFVYRTGISEGRYSYATAVGLFNSLLNLIILLIVNQYSKIKTGNSLW